MKHSYLSKLCWILAPLIVISIYSFIFFNGNFAHSTSDYFAILARAFSNGHTYLHIASSKVMSLPDPYSHKYANIVQADGGSWHDTAYFKGKYYIYHGPANAVALMLFHSLGLPIMTDGALVYLWSIISTISLAFFCSLFTAKSTSGSFFKMNFLPLPLGLLAYFFLTLNVGIFCCLARPLFYEAAITCASAFFWLGFGLAIYMVNQEKLSNFLQSLLITTTSLAFSFCFFARYTYGTSIFLATGLILILVYLKDRHNLTNVARNALFLITPLFITVILFCYYNYVRFGSIFNTGFFYQLTGTVISQPELAAKHLIFNSIYITSNLWGYFLSPLAYSLDFPFVQFISVSPPHWVKVPPLYYSFITTGLLILNKSLLYLGYIVLFYLISKSFVFKMRPVFSYKNSLPIISSILVFGALFVIQIIPLLLNINSEMRYYNDFIYAFYLFLFLLIYFLLHSILIKKRIISHVIYLIFGVCICINISLQFLISLNYYDAFKLGNPKLYQYVSLKVNPQYFDETLYTRIKPIAVWTNNEEPNHKADGLLNEQGGDWASMVTKDSLIRFSFDKPHPIVILQIAARNTSLNEYWQSYTLVGYKHKKLIYSIKVDAYKPAQKKEQVFKLNGAYIDTLDITGTNPVSTFSDGQLANGINPGFSQVKFFKNK